MSTRTGGPSSSHHHLITNRHPHIHHGLRAAIRQMAPPASSPTCLHLDEPVRQQKRWCSPTARRQSPPRCHLGAQDGALLPVSRAPARGRAQRHRRGHLVVKRCRQAAEQEVERRRRHDRHPATVEHREPAVGRGAVPEAEGRQRQRAGGYTEGGGRCRGERWRCRGYGCEGKEG